MAIVVTASASYLARAGTPAATTLGISTSTQLSVTVTFRSNLGELTYKDFTLDPRTQYTTNFVRATGFLSSSAVLSLTSSNGIGTAGSVNIGVTMPSYVAVAGLTGMLDILVVDVNAAIPLQGSLVKSMTSSVFVNSSTPLAQLSCTGVYQTGVLASVVVTLTDGSTRSGTPSLSSANTSVAIVSNNTVIAIAPGASIITATYATATGTFTAYVSGSAFAITSISLSYGSSTLSGQTGSAMSGSVSVQFSDGTSFANAITQFTPLSSLLGFNSSDVDSLVVSAAGVASLVNNSWQTASLTAFSQCGDGLYSAFRVAGNLAPVNYDTKLGSSSGLTFPPVSYGQSVDASIQVQVSSSPLTTYQVWLFYNTDVFSTPTISKGSGWPTGAFDFTTGNAVAGKIVKAVISFSSGYSATNSLVPMATVTFPVSTTYPILELITANVVALSVASGTIFQSATGSQIVAGTAYVSLNGGSVAQLRRRLFNVARNADKYAVSHSHRRLFQTISLPIVTGDCNGDGLFNANDATYAQQLVTNGAGSWPMSSVSQMRNCAPTYAYMFNALKSLYQASDIKITIADVSYLLHASTNRLFFLNISSPYDLVTSVPSGGSGTWNATASFYYYPSSTAVAAYSTAPCASLSSYFELNIALLPYSLSVGSLYGSTSEGVVFQGACNRGTFILSVLTDPQTTLNMSVGFNNIATGDAYAYFGMDVGVFVNPSTNFLNVHGSLIVSGPIFTLDLNVTSLFVTSSSPATLTPTSPTSVAASLVPTKQYTLEPTAQPTSGFPTVVGYTSPTAPFSVAPIRTPSTSKPTTVSTTYPSVILTSEPTITPTNSPTPAPIAVSLNVALYGVQESGISFPLTLAYSASSSLYNSYSAIAHLSLVSDGSNGPYVFLGATTNVYLRYQESLTFSITLDFYPDGYTCYLNTYSSSQSVSFAAPIPSPILLYCISTAAQAAGVTPPATGSADFTCGSSDGSNSSDLNSTLCASIRAPGSIENQHFTAAVTTSISQTLGISNSSVSVIVSVDSNGNTQLLIVFAPTSSPAVCSFRGNLTLAVNVAGTIITVRIGPYSSQLTGWVFAKVDSVIALPLYVSVPVGIVLVVFLLIAVCIFRRKFPYVKLIPVLSLLFSAAGFATNVLFVAYLNSVRLAGRSSSSAASAACLSTTTASSSLDVSATVMMGVAIFCLCVCAVFGWFSAARLLLPACQSRSNFVYSSGDLVSTGNSDHLSTKSYHFERWKKKHKCATYVVIFLCALSPKHMLILHSRFGGLRMFDCPFPKKAITYIQLWDLFPILMVYLPFTILQFASTLLLSGWTPQVTAYVTISCVQLAFNIATSTREYCKNRFACCKKLTENQWCPSFKVMKRYFCGKVSNRIGPRSHSSVSSPYSSAGLTSETDVGPTVVSIGLLDNTIEPKSVLSASSSRSSSSSSLPLAQDASVPVDAATVPEQEQTHPRVVEDLDQPTTKLPAPVDISVGSPIEGADRAALQVRAQPSVLPSVLPAIAVPSHGNFSNHSEEPSSASGDTEKQPPATSKVLHSSPSFEEPASFAQTDVLFPPSDSRVLPLPALEIVSPLFHVKRIVTESLIIFFSFVAPV